MKEKIESLNCSNDDIQALIYEIYQTTRAITKSINRALYNTTIYGSEWSILHALKKQGTMTQTALSNYLNIEPAAISKTLRQLIQKDLIIKKPGEDRREKFIFLSDTAEENYPTWERLIETHCNNISTAISKEECLKMQETLKNIHNTLESLD